ncbi:hypothetical protein [Pseudonocardia sp. DLS-67]
MLSTHHTSQGWVRYRRCVCGNVAIELVTLGPAAGTRVEPLREPAGSAPWFGSRRLVVHTDEVDISGFRS